MEPSAEPRGGGGLNGPLSPPSPPAKKKLPAMGLRGAPEQQAELTPSGAPLPPDLPKGCQL